RRPGLLGTASATAGAAACEPASVLERDQPQAPESPPLQGRHRQAGAVQLFPVELGRLLLAAVNDRLAGAVDDVGDLVATLQGDARNDARQRARHVVEGVVVVVADDHLPRASRAAPGRPGARYLDGVARHPAPG